MLKIGNLGYKLILKDKHSNKNMIGRFPSHIERSEGFSIFNLFSIVFNITSFWEQVCHFYNLFLIML